MGLTASVAEQGEIALNAHDNQGTSSEIAKNDHNKWPAYEDERRLEGL